MNELSEIRKLEGERKRLMTRVGKIDLRVGQLQARRELSLSAAKSLGAVAVKKSGRK